MDCRIKSGNDAGWDVVNLSSLDAPESLRE